MIIDMIHKLFSTTSSEKIKKVNLQPQFNIAWTSTLEMCEQTPVVPPTTTKQPQQEAEQISKPETSSLTQDAVTRKAARPGTSKMRGNARLARPTTSRPRMSQPRLTVAPVPEDAKIPTTQRTFSLPGFIESDEESSCDEEEQINTYNLCSISEEGARPTTPIRPTNPTFNPYPGEEERKKRRKERQSQRLRAWAARALRRFTPKQGKSRRFLYAMDSLTTRAGDRCADAGKKLKKGASKSFQKLRDADGFTVLGEICQFAADTPKAGIWMPAFGC